MSVYIYIECVCERERTSTAFIHKNLLDSRRGTIILLSLFSKKISEAGQVETLIQNAVSQTQKAGIPKFTGTRKHLSLS